MNILIISSVASFLIITLSFFFMPYVTPSSVQFGVRIPRDKEADPVISRFRREYQIILAAISLPVFLLFILLPAIAAYYSYSMLLIAAELPLAYLNYFRINQKLRTVKEQERWYEGVTETAGAVYPSAQEEKMTHWYLLTIIPSIVVIALTIYIGITVYPTLPSLIPTHFGIGGQPNRFSAKSIGSVFMLVFVQIALTAGIFLLGWGIFRTKQETDVSRPMTSSEQQLKFRTYMRDGLYLFSSMIDLTMMFSALKEWGITSSGLSVAFIVIPILAGSALLVSIMMLVGQQGSRLHPVAAAIENTALINRNDDKYWIGGGLYYNHEDPSILVGKRFGVGYTFNFAHPITWVIFGSLIGIPLIVVALIRLNIV